MSPLTDPQDPSVATPRPRSRKLRPPPIPGPRRGFLQIGWSRFGAPARGTNSQVGSLRVRAAGRRQLAGELAEELAGTLDRPAARVAASAEVYVVTVVDRAAVAELVSRI